MPQTMDWLESILVPINRDGHKFIALGIVLTLVFFYVWDPLGWFILVLTPASAFFFRDPDRVTPIRDKLIVAPADGIVAQVSPAVPPEELDLGDDPRLRISIYISLSDVHIHRIPVDGAVMRVSHRAGTFVASHPQLPASEDNERQSISLKTSSGKEIAVVQIAGRFARRIVCDLHDGQDVRAGQRFGLIRFGSRGRCVPCRRHASSSHRRAADGGRRNGARRRALARGAAQRRHPLEPDAENRANTLRRWLTSLPVNRRT